MPVPLLLLCPGCRYDLSSIAGEEGTCPECGRAFTRASVERRAAALVSLSLTLIAWGALASIVAVGAALCLRTALQSNVSGEAGYYGRVLRAVPAIVGAAGIGMLGWATGSTPVRRHWPGALAIFFTLVSLYALHQFQNVSSNYARVFQPHTWTAVGRWVYPVALGLMGVAGAAVLGRSARLTGSNPLGVCARVLGVCAALYLVTAVGARGHEEYAQALMRSGASAWGAGPPQPQFQPGPSGPTVTMTAPPPVPYHLSAVLNAALKFLASMIDWVVWIGLGLTALVVRAAWRAESEK